MLSQKEEKMSRIFKISLLLSAAVFLFFAGCKKNKPPDNPDKPSGPIQIRKNNNAEYTTRAHDPNKNNEIRYIFDWGDGSIDTTRYFPNDSIADTTHAWVDTGKYMIRAKAQDNKNALSKDWSDTLGVTVVLNLAPNIPSIPTGQYYGIPNIIYIFKTIAVDPDSDKVSVKFDWNIVGRNPTWTDYYASGDTIRDTVTFSNTGRYSIKVKAKDVFEEPSEWSNSLQFVVRTFGNHSPDKPSSPIGPFYGLPNTPYVFKTIVTDPDNDSVAVKFDWGDGRIPIWTKLYASGDSIQDTITYPDSGIFSIKVMAKDIFQDTSEWSDAFQFSIVSNLPPNRPLIFQKNEKGAINTYQTFMTTAIDPEGDSISIQFSFFSPGQWSTYHPSGDTIDGYAIWNEPGIKQIWAIAKDMNGSQSVSSETLDFEVLGEGYIKGVFQATTRPDQGEVDTVGMQSSPAIVNIGGIDKIFIGSEGGYAYIVNTQDMSKEASFLPDVEEVYDEEPWGNTPAVDITNSRWYIANDQGEIYCLPFLPGGEIWRFPGSSVMNFTGWSFTDATFNGNYVYVATEDTLFAIDVNAGLKIWFYVSRGAFFSAAPIVDAVGNVLVGDDSGYVRKLNGITGELIWKRDLGNWIPTSGAIDYISGTIYFGVNGYIEKLLCALEPDSGNVIWLYSLDEEIVTSLAMDAQGYIYFGDDIGRIHAVKDGFSKSGFPIRLRVGALDATLSTPSFAADNYFYVMTEEQHVFCIGTDGRIRWETPLPTSEILEIHSSIREADLIPSPVIGSDGDIYVAGGTRYIGLYQLQGRSSGIPAYTPWPMFRHDRQHTGKAGIPTR